MQAWFAKHIEQTLRIQIGMLALQCRVRISEGGIGQEVRVGQLVAGVQPVIAQLHQIAGLLIGADIGDVAAGGDVQVVRVQVVDFQCFVQILGQLESRQGLRRSDRPQQLDIGRPSLIVVLYATAQGLLVRRCRVAMPIRQAVIDAALQ